MISTTRGHAVRFAAMILALSGAAAVHAQGPPVPSPTPPVAPVAGQTSNASLVPLRLLVTISRYEGERRTSSLPFTLWLNANDGQTTRLQSIQEVPTSTAFVGPAGGNVAGPFRPIEYKTVGTRINASATQTGGGLFRVSLDINDSSVVPSKDANEAVVLTNLTTENVLLLTNGQTAEFAATSDKVTGEVTRISVTATVIK